ncbi:hypothetical protein FNV43_RR11149 [Rhamnella rubrinervis]|uniref:Uncharacterized protein n=1 Tax=Rhamnella rubrinervis TaxID=2594499 RepID=A0A8K0MHG4_9ROSA|nr:hypothetical protein FNV43_RR11149 [Rhamnella rubrinervis]
MDQNLSTCRGCRRGARRNQLAEVEKELDLRMLLVGGGLRTLLRWEIRVSKGVVGYSKHDGSELQIAGGHEKKATFWLVLQSYGDENSCCKGVRLMLESTAWFSLAFQ